MSKPKYLVNTKLGTVEATPTDGTHIYVSFASQYDKGEVLTVRNVPIRGSAHFYKYSDGTWQIGPEYSPYTRGDEPKRFATTYERRSSLHLTRTDAFYAEPSEHARKIIAEVLTSAILIWVNSKEGKAAIPEAAHLQKLEEIEKLEADIIVKQKELEALYVLLHRLKEPEDNE